MMTVLVCTLRCIKNTFACCQAWILTKRYWAQVLFWLTTADRRVQFTTPYHPPRHHPLSPHPRKTSCSMLCHAFISSLDGCYVTKIRHPISLVISNHSTQYSLVQKLYVVIIKLKGPTHPHLCLWLHARVWLLYFIQRTSKQRKPLWNYNRQSNTLSGTQLTVKQ